MIESDRCQKMPSCIAAYAMSQYKLVSGLEAQQLAGYLDTKLGNSQSSEVLSFLPMISSKRYQPNLDAAIECTRQTNSLG